MSQALSSASALGDWRLLFVQRDRLQAVTADDVNRVAKTYFQKQNRTVGIYIPQEQADSGWRFPAAPALDSLVKDYKGGTVTAAGEAFDPTPANLDARTSIIEMRRHQGRPPAKKNRGETVSLVLTLHYGNEDSLKGLTTAAGMLPGLMMAGTKKHDRQALREELDKLGIRISPGLGGGGGGGGGRRGGGGGGRLGQLTFSVEAKRDDVAGCPQVARRDSPRAGVPGSGIRFDETPRQRGWRRRSPIPLRLPSTGFRAPCRPMSPRTFATCPLPRKVNSGSRPSRSSPSSPFTTSNWRDRRRTGDCRRF